MLSPPVLLMIPVTPFLAWAFVSVVYLTLTHIAIHRSGYDPKVIRALAKHRPRLRLWR